MSKEEHYELGNKAQNNRSKGARKEKNFNIVKEVGVGESAVRKMSKKRDEIRQAAGTAKQIIAFIHMEHYLTQYTQPKREGKSAIR